MAKKAVPWLRALLIVVTLLLAQVQPLLAVENPPAGDDAASVSPDRAGQPLLRQSVQGCKVAINAYLLAAPFTGPPNPALPNYGASILKTEDPLPDPWAEAGAGDTTSWLVVAENRTADADCPAGDPAGNSEALTDAAVTVAFYGTAGGLTSTVNVPLSSDTMAADGDLVWGVFDFVLPNNIPDAVDPNRDLEIKTTFRSEAENNKVVGDDVVDTDTDQMFLNGPAFRVVSFESTLPDPPTASVGELVDWVLVIENTRTGSIITGITVTSPYAQFSGQCTRNPLNGAGDWTPVGGGSPITSLLPLTQAECVIDDVAVPSPAPDQFALVGDITVTDGNAAFDFTLTAISEAVEVELPQVSVTKTVSEIRRGGTTIFPTTPPGFIPPAAPGDVIDYAILVTNTGDVQLEDLWIVDTLMGPIILPPGLTIDAGGTLALTAQHIVRAGGQDPLINTVTVTAKGVGFPTTIEADASATVDIRDSALEVTLVAQDPATHTPVFLVNLGVGVEYVMTLTNTGDTQINDLEYVTLSAPLHTYGTPPAITPDFLVAGGSITLSWVYTVGAGDPDPLINTVRVRGIIEGAELLHGQAQASIDLVSAGLDLNVIVTEPVTATVLRGNPAEYAITVTNRGSNPICNVQVDQYRRDPDTGIETPLIIDVPLIWPNPALPGQLGPDEAATGVTTYLVTAADKDPLDMIFEVNATDDCPTGGPLTDRTTRVLDISDAQVNAELVAGLGADGVGEVGDPVVFTFLVQNVGAVTLEHLSATYCMYWGTEQTPFCNLPFDPDKPLTPDTIGTLDTASGGFTYVLTTEDSEAIPFVAEVTMLGQDNKGNEVSIKAATAVPIGTDDIVIELTGPAEAVIGDTETFGFMITNEAGMALTNVRVYNMLETDAGDPYGYRLVGSAATLLPDVGQNVLADEFQYTIKPGAGIVGDQLIMQIRVLAESGIGNLLANGTLNVMLIPMITVDKSGDGAAAAGDAVNYLVSITNNSHSQNYTVTAYDDAVLEGYGVTINHASFSPWPGTPGILPWGTSISGAFQIPDPPGVNELPDPLVNTFTVVGTREYDGESVTGFDTHEVDIACPISFNAQVTNMDDDPDDILGEMLSWQISFTNHSGTVVDSIAITESLHWGSVVPSLEIGWPNGTGTLNPGQTAVLPVFEEQILGEHYIPDPDVMSDALRADFNSPDGASFCEIVLSYPVHAPVYPIKIPNPFIAFSGQTVNYTIFIVSETEDNDGEYSRYFVTLSDSLLEPDPMPMRYDGPLGPETNSGWVDPEEIIEKTVPRVVQPDDPAELVNIATIEYDIPDHPDDSVDYLFVWWEAMVFTGNPLQLTKVPSTDRAAAGTTITYDYSITNISPYPVTDVSMTDTLIGNLAPDMTGGLISLDPGVTFVGPLEVPYTIPLDSADPITNTVTATGTVILPDTSTLPVTNSLTVQVDLEDTDLQVTKSARKDDGTGQPGAVLDDFFPPSGPDGIPEVETGTDVHYCFLVENQNTGTTTYVDNIQISDAMFSAGALQGPFEAAVGALPSHGGAETDRLYGQESVNFCYGPVTVNRTMGDPLVNLVLLTGQSSGGFDIFTSDDFTIDILGTDLLITKVPSPPLAFVGDTVTYTITIRNNNDSLRIVNLAVTDLFEGGAPVPIPLDAFNWDNSGVPGTPVGILQPQGGYATYTYEYTVQSDDPDPLRNYAAASGQLEEVGLPEAEWDITEDSTTATVAITASQLVVHKSATPSVSRLSANNCGDPGQPACETVRYTISVTNVGALPVLGIVVVDRHFDATTGAPAEVVYDEAKPDELTTTTLGPSGTAFVYYDLPMPTQQQVLDYPELDPFINLATAYGVVLDPQTGLPVPMQNPDPGDPYDDDKSVKSFAYQSVDLLQPSIRISKSPVTLAAAPGQGVTYNITIRNVGDEALDHLVFRDVTGPVTINLDAVCPNVVLSICPFIYGPEPYTDDDGNPVTPEIPNPMNGLPYDEAHKLQPMEQLTGSVVVNVPADWAENEFTNVVEISGQTPTASPVIDRSSATIDIRSEGIDVEKLASLSSAPVGADVTYTVRVTNIGGSPLERLVIADPGIDSEPDRSVTIENGFPDSPEDQIPGNDSETLDTGEQYTYPYVHRLVVTDGDPYVNRVTVAGYTAASSTVINVAQTSVDVQGASMTVDKIVCVGTDGDGNPATQPDPCETVVNIGDANPDDVTYYVHIVNTGSIGIEQMTVTDNVGTPGVITWPGPNNGLAPTDGAAGGPDELWIMYPYTIQFDDPDPLVNLLTVSGVTASGANIQVTDTASLTLVTGDLRLTKAAADEGTLGETITYTLTVENLGVEGSAISGITVIDPLSSFGSLPIPDCNVASLGVGETHPCTFDHQISLADASPLVNMATARGTQDSVTVTDTAVHTLNILSPGLTVTKTADVQFASIGQTVTFTYVVTNTGTSAVNNLLVDDSDPNADFSANPWPGFLGVGETAIRTWSRQMTVLDPDPYTNTMTVTGTAGGQPVNAQATETVFIANNELVVTNTPNRTFATPGQQVTFTYVVTNLGEFEVTALSVSDNLCGDLSAQLSSTTLAPGLSATVFCTVTAALPGPIISTVYAEATATGGGTVFDAASSEVAVTSGGVLVIKSADRLAVGTTPPDNVITYTIEITNIGTESLTGITVDDPMLVGLSSAPPATLAASSTHTMTGTYTVPAVNPPPSVTNTVMVEATGATTGDPYSDSDSVSVAVLENPEASLILTKEVSMQRVRPGQTVDYIFTVRNISAGVASNITISDPVLAGVIAVPDLGPGNVAIVNGSATIPADYTLPVFTNTAQVLIDDQVQDTSSVDVIVELLTLDKVAAPAEVTPGEDITYTFTVTSYTQGTVTDVTLSDPTITAWDSILPTDIPPAGGTAQATVTVPADWTDETFDNTAQLLIAGEIVDTDTASVNVTGTGLEVAINSVIQRSGPTILQPPLQTGEPIEVTVTLTNAGTQVVTTPGYTADIGLTGLVCQHIGAPLPASLDPSDGAPGGPDEVTATCTFTPPVGLADYRAPGGLTRTLTVTATGTAGGEGLTETVSGSLPLVDILLAADLSISTIPAGPVVPGSEAFFTLTLTNQGASPIGCTGIVPDTEPCHIRFAALTTTPSDPEMQALIQAFSTDINNLVLNATLSASFTAPPYTVLSSDVTTVFNIVVDAGYYSVALYSAGLLEHYRLLPPGATDITTLTMPAPSIDVGVVVTPDPPVFGQPVSYSLTITNTGDFQITNLSASYTITPDGSASQIEQDGIMLVGQNLRQTSGTFSLDRTIIEPCVVPCDPPNPNQIARGILAKTEEDQDGPYIFTVNVSGRWQDGDQSRTIRATVELPLDPDVSGIPDSTPTATATGTLGGTGTGTATATLDPNATNPVVTKTPSIATAQPGAAVAWTITIYNGGTAIMPNVTVQDQVPDTMALGTATTSKGVSVISGQLVTITTGALNPGETVTITLGTTINGTVAAPATINNTVCAARDGGTSVCATGTVSLGPAVTSLPETGLTSTSPRGVLVDPALLGALMLLMAAQVSRRRMWMAALFLLIALALVAGAVVVLVSGGGDEDEAQTSGEAQGAPTGTATVQEETPAPVEVTPETTAEVEPTLAVTPGALVLDFPPTPTPYVVPQPAGPRYLMIPKLGDQFRVPIPIVDLPIVNEKWDVSGLGYYVGWLHGTTWMDPAWGNTVLAAHVQLGTNNPGPFWGLGELAPGDEIVITEGDEEHRFEVTTIRKVDPSDWTVTAPTTGPTLTLITCTEWDNSYGIFSQRLVVRAVPILG